MLVATQNPCACGFATDPKKTCECSAHEVHFYIKKFSDHCLTASLLRLKFSALTVKEFYNESSQTRRKSSRKAEVSGTWYSKTVKVARTIADIEGAANIATHHVAEALQYRRCKLNEGGTT